MNNSGFVYLEIYLDASLTGASWGTPTNATAAETAVESDNSATAISGGTRIFGPALLNAGAGARGSDLRLDIDFDIPEGSVVTLAATSLSGTNNVTSAFSLREEW